jgi:hypothetical protein
MRTFFSKTIKTNKCDLQTQNGQTSLNNNLLSDSTRDFRNQSQQQPQPQQSQQQIILKHECVSLLEYYMNISSLNFFFFHKSRYSRSF